MPYTVRAWNDHSILTAEQEDALEKEEIAARKAAQENPTGNSQGTSGNNNNEETEDTEED